MTEKQLWDLREALLELYCDLPVGTDDQLQREIDHITAKVGDMIDNLDERLRDD